MSPTTLTISFCVLTLAGIVLAIVTRSLRAQLAELKRTVETMEEKTAAEVQAEVRKEFEAHKEEIKAELMEKIMAELKMRNED